MWLWILLILCLNKLGIDLSGGEEHYLSFAKQWINPDWIPNSFVYSEYAGSRLIFQCLVGNILQVASFEWTTLICRFLNFALFAHALSLLFKLFRFNHLTVWLGLQLYLIITQSFFSSAWMLISFEPKTIAYALCIYGIYYYLGRRYILGFIFLGIAAYFHILVGCWLALYLCIHTFLFRKEFKIAVKSGLIFSVIIAPLVYYFLQGMSSEMLATELGISANQIYAYYRLPHHIGIFKTIPYFQETHFVGVISMICSMLTLLLIGPHLKDTFNTITEISLIIGSIVLSYIFVAFIDHTYCSNSGNFLLKSYPFRGNVWIKFFFLLILSSLIMGLASRMVHNKFAARIIIIVLLASTMIQCINNIKRSLRQSGSEERKNMLIYIRNEFPPSMVFSTIGLDEKDRYSLGRLLEREPFVEFKFVPAGTSKIYEWYRRCRLFDHWQSESFLESLSAENVGIIIADKKLNFESLDFVKSFGKYFVYRNTKSR